MGDVVRMKRSHLCSPGSEDTATGRCNCHHPHRTCPLSRADKGQQRGENRTQRARFWARKGQPELPTWGPHPGLCPLCLPPASSSPPFTGKARLLPQGLCSCSFLCWGCLPYPSHLSCSSQAPSSPPPGSRPDLPGMLVPSVQLWFYICLGHLILVCLPA